MAGYCQNCGKPLPKDARPTRKYCDNACKNQRWRHTRKPQIRQKTKIPPSDGTGDDEIDKILDLKYEASLRKRLLDELLEKRREEGRRDALKDTETWKEDRTLDADTAKQVAKILTRKYDPSVSG